MKFVCLKRSQILKYVVALVLLLFGGVRVFQVLISPKEAAVYSFSWEPVAFFSLFVVFSIIASGYIKRTVDFLKGSIRSVGIISGFLEVKDIDNQVGYKPIVTYKDMDGQEHKFHSSVLKDNKKEIGREVPIRYKMQEPSAAEVDSFLAIWAIPIFFILVAFLSLVFSFIS